MIGQSLKMAWKSIASNKMRSFLTMLGIIIGVMSLVVLVSLVSGTTESVNSQISAMGTDTITVTVRDDKERPLKLADIEALAEHEEIGNAAPVAQTTLTATSVYEEESVSAYGTTGAYAEIRKQELYTGRFLKNTDIDNHTNVAVVNAGFATEIMGRMDVEGESVKLDGMEYRIVGVLAAKDSDTSTTENCEVYIPYTSMIRLTDHLKNEVTSFCAAAAENHTADEAEEILTEEMMNRFSQDEDAFTVINQSTVQEAMENVNSMLALMLGGIAAISLLVGGIGIMNIMLVSVTERTREIGIRKVVGAGRGDILLQFLIEALLLSLVGCAVGILLSWIALRVISAAGDSGTVYRLSVGVVWIAVAFSTGIGVIFGLYPAGRAAGKRPIEALRYTG